MPSGVVLIICALSSSDFRSLLPNPLFVHVVTQPADRRKTVIVDLWLCFPCFAFHNCSHPCLTLGYSPSPRALLRHLLNTQISRDWACRVVLAVGEREARLQATEMFRSRDPPRFVCPECHEFGCSDADGLDEHLLNRVWHKTHAALQARERAIFRLSALFLKRAASWHKSAITGTIVFAAAETSHRTPPPSPPFFVLFNQCVPPSHVRCYLSFANTL